VSYIARVRITITAGERSVIREGSGAGHGIAMDQGLAHESALKEAETDATKQALMTFGNAFGLARDDKQQRQVATSHPAAEGSGPAARAPSGLLQGVLRCLPRAHEPTLPCGVHHHQPPAALDGECPGGEAIDLKPATLRLPNGSEKVLIRNTMEFEFDPLKSRVNRAKHGIA
jgi:hypothetical protein